MPSTPSDPSLAVIRGTDECLGDEIPLLRRLFHGSTVATNAVLEPKGGRTALVTTRGFKDILVLQRQTRPNVNSIVCRKPEPLVPLRRTVEATERVSVGVPLPPPQVTPNPASSSLPPRAASPIPSREPPRLEFPTSYQSVGFRPGGIWFPWKNTVVRMNVEYLELNRSPVGALSLLYTVGGNEPVFQSNFMVYF